MVVAFDFDTVIKIVSPVIVAIVGAIAKYVIEGKPRLITYLVQASEHPLPAAPPANAAPVANAPAPPVIAGAPGPPGPPGPIAQPAPQGVRAVHTHAYVVRNTGKRSAHNVRIGHNVFPLSYRLWPAVSHQLVHSGHDASAEIILPVLTPDEQVTISYLYLPPLTWHNVNSYVKSDETMAKTIEMIPTPQIPRALRWALWFLIFVGASAVVYSLLRILPDLLR